jgi:voltage-gated potassium channel
MSKFLREPPSIRIAASVIVVATAMVVVGGGVLIRVLDHSEYASVWVGMWWALQTVTTVGYGDVTPKHWPAGSSVRS